MYSERRDGRSDRCVSNAATGNLLEGARVDLPQLGLSALVDNTGRYVLAGIPPGNHEVIASYIELDSTRQQVTIAPGQHTTRDFDLTAGIYRLQATALAPDPTLYLKGLGGFANFTALETHGDFGGRANLSTGHIAGFVPRTANVGVTWRYLGLNSRVLINYTGNYNELLGREPGPESLLL
jgi:hypothetical protein